MLKKLGCHSAVVEYWNAVAPHVQALFCHSSLGVKIHMNRIGEFEFLSDRTANQDWIKNDILMKKDNEVSTMVSTGNLKLVMEGNDRGAGWAWSSAVCRSDTKGKATSGVEWYADPIKFAGVSLSTCCLELSHVLIVSIFVGCGTRIWT